MNPSARHIAAFCLLAVVHWTCFAQAPYNIGHFIRDRAIGARVDSAYKAGNPALALQLHRTRASHWAGEHFWRARLAWEAQGSSEAELRQAFNGDYHYVPNTPPDRFEIAHAMLLSKLSAASEAELDTFRMERCLALIERDQVLASGSDWDSLAHRATVDTLDALIREGGWPSSYPLGAVGVATVLAHQHWDRAQQFEPYQALIEAECREERENWTVALFVLQQRIRWTARNRADTVHFKDVPLSDEDPALPTVVAISDRMVSNGHKHVWIHAADSLIALEIGRCIINVQPKVDMAQEVLEMLKARNHDHPAPLTPERITYVIDPALPRDRFLYRMD